MEISFECVNGFAFIKEHLNRLQRILPPKSFDAIWKQFANSIDALLMDDIILSQHYDISFIKQFIYDMGTFYALFRSWTKKPESYFPK